jgi:DNA-binding XRE family transcriptional regulator
MTVKSISEVLDASKRVTNYIQTNKKTPKTVNVGGLTVGRASFNRMLAATIIEIYNNSNQNIRTDTVKDPSNPQGGLGEGQLQKADYIDAAKRTYLFIESNKQMPNYINTKLGIMSPFNFMDMYSRALNYYDNHDELPNLIYTNSLVGATSPSTPITVTIPSNLKPYLTATKNCQVTSSTIKSLANSLKKSTVLGTAQAIYNYVLGLGYLYYYNTNKGALGTLKAKAGNCCDLSHLLIALLRAAGIPAWYRHVLAEFSSGQIGHVYVRAYVNGKYVSLDASNNKNSYNNIVSWKFINLYSEYKELPF